MFSYNIKSSNLDLLQNAKRIAHEYAKKQINKNTVGIVFLGAIVRGYYDKEADIDIAIFENESVVSFETNTIEIEGLHLQYFKLNYENEKSIQWEMGKRWAYSNVSVFYDPEKKIDNLLSEKVPLKKEERKQLLMVGISLSEWYVNGLTQLWINRGNLLSAHYMINEGINHFFTALYVLNNELVADFKWRVYCAEQLDIQPPYFKEKILRVIQMKELTENELEIRRSTFMDMWNDILPKIEKEVGSKFEIFRNTI